MTAAKLVTRWDIEAALARIDKGQGTHDDANLIRAAMQAMENQVRQMAAELERERAEPKAKG